MSETPESAEDRLRQQIEAYHAAALAHACVKLGLPETMGAEAWTAARLAAKLDLSAPHLERTLRGLATLGLVAAHPDRTFTLTALGRALAPGSSSTLREKLLIVVEQYWQPWANLAACIKSGAPAFEQVFGTSVAAWRRDHKEHGETFDAYLAHESFANAQPLLATLDLAGAETVADIGGGQGGLLGAILKANPGLRGVLFDGPQTVAAAKPYLQALGVADRVSFVAGDFLREIPVEADIYVLKAVLQQHEDAAAGIILERCRKALRPGAKLIVIERLMPERTTDDPAAIMLDLHMMAISGGKARAKAEMEALLADAGLAITKTSQTADGLALIEATLP
ncbi:MAG TPA: methyltransferase [Methyloceanibacter sp.]|nr:methyltransferase [Methyloceanibacter sp.]